MSFYEKNTIIGLLPKREFAESDDWIAEYDIAKDNQKSGDVPVGRSRI